MNKTTWPFISNIVINIKIEVKLLDMVSRMYNRQKTKQKNPNIKKYNKHKHTTVPATQLEKNVECKMSENILDLNWKYLSHYSGGPNIK